MSLEVNENNQSNDESNLRRPSKVFTRTIAGVLTTVALYYYGMGLNTNSDNASSNDANIIQDYDQDYLNTEVEIPPFYKEQIAQICGKLSSQKITIADLLRIDKFTGSLTAEASLDFLNYCENIEQLSLYVESLSTSNIKSLKGFKFLKEISLVATIDYIPKEERFVIPTVNSIDFAFLRNCPNLESLTISGMGIEPGVVEGLTTLKTLSIDTDENYDIDFSKLTFLDELEFFLEKPYTLAKDFTLEEYKTLIDNDVNVVFAEEEYLEMFLKINKKLATIVDSLNLTPESTDQEKLDAILIYTLDNLKYDPDISKMIKNNENLAGKSSQFYQEGVLYGALEMDTVICGNYAALVDALASRVGLKSYYAKSTNHAWNIAEVEGKLYYVDSTMLDISDFRIVGESEWRGEMVPAWAFYPAAEAIAEGNTEYLEWYMEDPMKYGEADESITHDAVNIPTYINIRLRPVKEDEKNNIDLESCKTDTDTTISSRKIKLDGKNFEVTIGDRTWIINAGATIGIMTALGGAIALSIDDKRREKNSVEQSNYVEEKFVIAEEDCESIINVDDSLQTSSYDLQGEVKSILDDTTSNASSNKVYRKH